MAEEAIEEEWTATVKYDEEGADEANEIEEEDTAEAKAESSFESEVDHEADRVPEEIKIESPVRHLRREEEEGVGSPGVIVGWTNSDTEDNRLRAARTIDPEKVAAKFSSEKSVEVGSSAVPSVAPHPPPVAPSEDQAKRPGKQKAANPKIRKGKANTNESAAERTTDSVLRGIAQERNRKRAVEAKQRRAREMAEDEKQRHRRLQAAKDQEAVKVRNRLENRNASLALREYVLAKKHQRERLQQRRTARSFQLPKVNLSGTAQGITAAFGGDQTESSGERNAQQVSPEQKQLRRRKEGRSHKPGVQVEREMEVLRCIQVREETLQKVIRLATDKALMMSPERADNALAMREPRLGYVLQEMTSLFSILRTVGVQLVEAIANWRRTRQADKAFIWEGRNYLVKMVSDMDVLQDVSLIARWIPFPLRRNPFIIEPEGWIMDEPLAYDRAARSKRRMIRRIYRPGVGKVDLLRIRAAEKLLFREASESRERASHAHASGKDLPQPGRLGWQRLEPLPPIKRKSVEEAPLAQHAISSAEVESSSKSQSESAKESLFTALGGIEEPLSNGSANGKAEMAVRQEVAAVKVQSLYRGHLARMEVARIRLANGSEVEVWGARDLDEAVEAAIKVQASYRGYAVRKHYRVRLDREGTQETACLPKIEVEVFDQEEVDAATKIQSIFRGHLMRAKPSFKPEFRGFSFVSSIENPWKERFATKIQAVFRGHRDRLLYRQKLESSRAEESSRHQNESPPYQGDPSGAAVLDSEQAAIRVQSRYRGHRERKRVTSRRSLPSPAGEQLCFTEDAEAARAAVTVQSVYRGHRDRQYVRRHRSNVSVGKRSVEAEETAAETEKDGKGGVEKPSDSSSNAAVNEGISVESASASQSVCAAEDVERVELAQEQEQNERTVESRPKIEEQSTESASESRAAATKEGAGEASATPQEIKDVAAEAAAAIVEAAVARGIAGAVARGGADEQSASGGPAATIRASGEETTADANVAGGSSSSAVCLSGGTAADEQLQGKEEGKTEGLETDSEENALKSPSASSGTVEDAVMPGTESNNPAAMSSATPVSMGVAELSATDEGAKSEITAEQGFIEVDTEKEAAYEEAEAKVAEENTDQGAKEKKPEHDVAETFEENVAEEESERESAKEEPTDKEAEAKPSEKAEVETEEREVEERVHEQRPEETPEVVTGTTAAGEEEIRTEESGEAGTDEETTEEEAEEAGDETAEEPAPKDVPEAELEGKAEENADERTAEEDGLLERSAEEAAEETESRAEEKAPVEEVAEEVTKETISERKTSKDEKVEEYLQTAELIDQPEEETVRSATAEERNKAANGSAQVLGEAGEKAKMDEEMARTAGSAVEDSERDGQHNVVGDREGEENE